MNSPDAQPTTKNDAAVRKRTIDLPESERRKILTELTNPGNSTNRGSHVDPDAASSGIIKMHLRRLEQLFDSLDHSPFREKDLDRNAEEYIVDSIKELPSKTHCEIVIYLDEPIDTPAEKDAIAGAIHVHFARRVQIARQNLRQLLRRGSISLGIGLSFLVTFFLLGQLVRRIMGEDQWAFLLRESLMIGGWVAMWKPLEIFLYDWWPIVGERRLYDRLSDIKVQIIQTDSRPSSAQTLGSDPAPPNATKQ